MDKKCVLLFSGGLDSRLAVKIMKERGYKILAVYFKLPFHPNKDEEIKYFLKKEKIKLKIIDCTKGKLFKEYIKKINHPKYSRGKGYNPCIDCKIFMYNKTREFANKNKVKYIVSGEVIGQRPMSQKEKTMNLIESDSKLKNRIIRPLMDFGAKGKQRKKQIEIAKKFNIEYPQPAGGCILCEKNLKNRFKKIFERGFEPEQSKLFNIGRHFLIENCWTIIGRNKQENEVLEKMDKGTKITSKDLKIKGPSALIIGKPSKEIKEKVKKMIKTYSKTGSEEEREKFLGFRI